MECTYFVAPDEATAAELIDGRVDRPGVVYVDASFEPVVEGGKLWALLAGCSFEDTLSQGRREPVAMSEDGQSLVLELAPGFVAGLAGADEARLREVAVEWAEAEEFGGMFEPDELADQAAAVAGVARRAATESMPLYCHWLV